MKAEMKYYPSVISRQGEISRTAHRIDFVYFLSNFSASPPTDRKLMSKVLNAEFPPAALPEGFSGALFTMETALSD